MKSIQKGFTLIELMIVVAIIAILAAIAIPAYQDFLKRSRVTDMITQLGACKTSVAEYYSTKAIFPATSAVAGCATDGTENSTAPTVAGNSIVTTAAGPIAGLGNVQFVATLAATGTPPAIVAWVCAASGAPGTTILPRFLPAQCR
jgi:type IV pilus assembly protein PilA